jgi:Ca2+-binding RTX toxin-like protein
LIAQITSRSTLGVHGGATIMVFQIISLTAVGGGPQVFLAAVGDGAYVPAGVLVGSVYEVGVTGQVGGLDVMIDGTVSGAMAGVRLGDSGYYDQDQWVFVGSTGVIRAQTTALYVQGHHSHVTNYGQIGGGATGVALCGQGESETRLVNHGVIAADTGIKRSAITDSETIHVMNTGTIAGHIAAFDGLLVTVTDIFVNRGLVIGDVRLGGGDDRFDTRGAGEVQGTIFGGAGDDTFLLGAAEDVIDGGTGLDTIDATGSGAMTLALDGSVAGTGRTLGDSLTGIETVLGSHLGGDQLYGTTGAQTLSGQGGADRLEGRTGSDTLLGGDGNDVMVGEAGVDLLNGGAGDDRFVFRARGEAGDIIANFGAVLGDNDLFVLTAAGFGGGFAPGALVATRFQTRTDNVAQDADDRFIFRTTDKTLWFDANGNVAGGLTLLAHLPMGAVVTAADILLV